MNYVYFIMVFPLNNALKNIHAISLNIKSTRSMNKFVCNHPFVPIIPSSKGTTHVIFHPVEDCARVQGFITPLNCVNIDTYHFEKWSHMVTKCNPKFFTILHDILHGFFKSIHWLLHRNIWSLDLEHLHIIKGWDVIIRINEPTNIDNPLGNLV
jgi:hypothetical protein